MAPPTNLTKLVLVTKEVELANTRDMDGSPVVVRVRKMQRSELLVLLGGFPQLVPDPGNAKDAARPIDPLHPKNIQMVKESVALANTIITMCAVEPGFYDGAPIEGKADVNVIDDDDKGDLCDAVFSMSASPEGASSDVARFPAVAEGGPVSQ